MSSGRRVCCVTW
ncbi:hypothetical protein LEMLEM_LOCUS25719 [Lemmus lemmus]